MKTLQLGLLLAFCAIPLIGLTYPIDGYGYTGIRRLLFEQNIAADSTMKSKLQPGAQLKMHEIQLFLTDQKSTDYISGYPEIDTDLQKKINSLFGGLNPNYSISVLDIIEGMTLRYAERKSSVGYQPGSVGKLIVMTAFFYELNRLYPNDWEKQREVLIHRFVSGGPFAVPNTHTVPFYDLNTGKYMKRHPKESDVFSLYEWLDHMVSVSSNAAASVCYRELILMNAFGEQYECLEESVSDNWFRDIPKDSLSSLANFLIHRPLKELGITEDEWRLGQPFTRGASAVIRAKGGSIGTTKGVMKWLLAMERGEIVNERISLEIKRLIYLTDRRIRYGASYKLNNAMLCYKSGSLYSCKEEPGYTCQKYKGNRLNFMNSVAIVEHEDCSRYMVVLMSNVLKKNSAGDHYGLASSIDNLIRNRPEEKISNTENYKDKND